MRLHSQLLAATCCCILATIFVGCGNKSGVRITAEGHQQRDPAPVISHNAPHIVHIDLFERIATIRNGISLGDEFLIATNYAGVETAVLKTRPSASLTLVTADILEGAPKINNTVKTADVARSTELAKIYRNLDEEN